MTNIFSCFATLIFYVSVSSCSSAVDKTPISTNPVSISKGKAIFISNCSGCHNFNQRAIGPDLSGVTEQDSIGWLKEFILEPKKKIDAGDAHAKMLLADYHQLMPSFAFNDTELNELISFLHTKNIRQKFSVDSLAIKNPVVEKIQASDIEPGLELISRLPPSSDQEPRTRISKLDWIGSAKAWFILDQRGILYKQQKNNPVEWLNISKWKSSFINQPGLGTGFGSFAFHPGFAKNGLFYTTHTEAAHSKKADFAIPDSVGQTLQWVLCEWKAENPDGDHFSGTNRELMRIDMASGIHGMQEIIFNPAAKRGTQDYGQLYAGVGDGGSVENGYAFLTKHPERIWGTILRIDPSGNNSVNGQYGISNSNPFVKDSLASREIYAYGFRNPNKITWTNEGLMLATNIGQANIEAIDLVQKGHDYGWPFREGNFEMHPGNMMNNLYPLPANDSNLHITYPVAVYDHDEGKAIEGGYEYHGKAVPALRGKYVFGDIPTGRLFYINIADIRQGRLAIVKEWFVSMKSKRVTLHDLCGQDRVDLRLATDAQGEIILSTKADGKIYRVVKD